MVSLVDGIRMDNFGGKESGKMVNGMVSLANGIGMDNFGGKVIGNMAKKLIINPH